ncbi:hypothetical protein RI129_013204 [Pyrocoelia pectoralis]|uniref:Protein CUSTOS n=1 Tax=Pyrocoelia pectoralis TaxID=417401 RepID=A0AAN7V7S4_9COLE
MDNSDEENERLRAALDPEFINNSIVADKSKKNVNLASSRCRNKDADQFNTLGVTPQFQAHVAKKLSEMLDKTLEKRLTTKINSFVPQNSKKGGVRLFKNSPKRIKLKKSINVQARVVRNVDDPDDNDDKFSEIAVNPADILKKREVANWSTKTKGTVLHYKQQPNGTLTFIS